MTDTCPENLLASMLAEWRKISDGKPNMLLLTRLCAC